VASEPILINGEWVASDATGTFQAINPATGEALPPVYPISSWNDLNAALDAATDAFWKLRTIAPTRIGDFLATFADHIEANTDAIAAVASEETGLPAATRLAGGELPRTANQLRQAAAAAKDGSWAEPTIDTATGVRSCFGAIGPVVVFGPNNFPLAFNGVSGGDFAAAVAAGNPVIAKAHPSHAGTSKLLANAAAAAAQQTEMPSGTVQMVYKMSRADGLRLAEDPRVSAIGYTGSRAGGLALKQACDKHGKPAYLELSSINPVVVLPGALGERGDAIADEFTGSCLMAAGQFCTNPGLVLLLAGEATETFIGAVKSRFSAAENGVLLNASTQENLAASIEQLKNSGAEIIVGGQIIDGASCRYANTLLRTTGEHFLSNPTELQHEAFGNSSLMVVCSDLDQLVQTLHALEGNLTGCVYSDTRGSDDAAYDQLAVILRQKVGRLINDKMPTGVAVSPAMNHGGPFPATGHAGFTAVGIPASLRRFAMLQCFDNVRPSRLPSCLQDANPNGRMWRLIDGNWSQADVDG
jgi:NADP-dependent aldehyde dehydrogenase